MTKYLLLLSMPYKRQKMLRGLSRPAFREGCRPCLAINFLTRYKTKVVDFTAIVFIE